MEKQVTASKLPNTAPGCPLKALFTFRSVEKKVSGEIRRLLGKKTKAVYLCVYLCVCSCVDSGQWPVPSKDVSGLWAKTGGLFLLNKDVCCWVCLPVGQPVCVNDCTSQCSGLCVHV